MKLPRPTLLISLFLVLSLLVPKTAAYAQTAETSQPTKTPTKAQSVKENKTSKDSSVAKDEEGEVKGIWLLLGATLLASYLYAEFGDQIAAGINCVKDFNVCVEGALYTTQNYAYKTGVGCNFSLPTTTPGSTIQFPAGKDGDCSRDKINAYLNGASLAETPSPGLLDITNAVVVSSFSLPVPIKSSQYFASINPFKETRAQGFTSELDDNGVLLNIWKSMRNVSYALLVVVLVIIGFLVMVRWKLDPRTSVTVQSALPRVVIAMILITFSYAIAGLMVDITRVITELLLGVLPGDVAFNMGAIVLLIVGSLGAGALAIFANSWIAAVAVLALALIILLLTLIIFIFLIYKILVRFAIFIVLTILAPLFFLAGALPGGDGILLNWFKRQSAALIAIPAIAFMVKLSFLIGFSSFTAPGSVGSPAFQALPIPWFLGRPLDSLLGWMAIGPLLGLGLFFFATKVPDITDEIFGIKEMGRDKGMGPGTIAGFAAGAVTGVGSAAHSFTRLKNFGEKYSEMEGWRGYAGKAASRVTGTKGEATEKETTKDPSGMTDEDADRPYGP